LQIMVVYRSSLLNGENSFSIIRAA